MAPHPPGRAFRLCRTGLLTGVSAWLAAGVVTVGMAAPVGATSSPVEVRVSPESGGPGTQVTVAGSGFCARSGCAPVMLSVLGQRVGQDTRPDDSGRFQVLITMPGGLPSGNADIEAKQVLDDGNELLAFASFVYSPSKGEAAEREAETRDFLTNLLNPTAPVPAPRGSALTTPSTTAPAGPAAPPTGLETAGPSTAADEGGRLVLLLGLVGAAIAALGGGAAYWLRTRRKRSVEEAA